MIKKALTLLGVGIGLLNMWFVYEVYRVNSAEGKDPLTNVQNPNQPTAQQYKSLHPVNGSIYKMYAAMRMINPADYELHVVNTTWDSQKFAKHVQSNDITHIVIAGNIYQVLSYVGSITKDACTDFMNKRCDILESDAPLEVDVYTLKLAASLKSDDGSNTDIIETTDLIEHHVWVIKLN